MRVILLRHGQTAANLCGRYNGRTDEPLCAEGRAAAAALGVCPAVRRVYVSPLLRARQTAAVCFPNAVQVAEDGFREMDFGDFEGRTAEEMANDAAYTAWVNGGCLAACPNGESLDALRERTARAFDAVLRAEMERGAKTVAFVAHGGTIMAVMDRFAREKRAYYEWRVPNASGYAARADAETWETDPALTGINFVLDLTQVN